VATHFKAGLAIGEKDTATDLTLCLKGSVSVTVSALAAAAEEDIDVTVTGAQVGDVVWVNPTEAAAETGLAVAAAWVSAANTVSIRVSNLHTSGLTGSTENWNYVLISSAAQ
jgi:hypothetical protein